MGLCTSTTVLSPYWVLERMTTPSSAGLAGTNAVKACPTGLVISSTLMGLKSLMKGQSMDSIVIEVRRSSI